MNPVSEALLAWYDCHARRLPWRGIHDPYRTWVSEAMLQQTRVETVLLYFDRFISRFPDLPSLSAASEADVMKMWEGLGYYSRARNLWNGAKKVMSEFSGRMPEDVEVLRSLPGVGPYMAGAIASIAFGIPVPAVDGNVIRVITRLYNIDRDVSRPDVRRHVENLAGSLVPSKRPGDHNQAMMDLGAIICVPGTPDCESCPVSAYCESRLRGIPERLPVIPGAKPPKNILWTVPVIRSGDRVMMRLRSEKLLQGLWSYPMLEGHLDTNDLILSIRHHFGIDVINVRNAGTARHAFTHQFWNMLIYTMTSASDAAAANGYEMIRMDDISKIALPAAMTAARRAMEKEFLHK